MNEVEEYYLQHFGVKGMKWGVRKNRKSASKKSSKGKTSSNKKRKPLTKERVAAIALGAAAIGIAGTYAYSMAADYKLETNFDVNSYLRDRPYGRTQPRPNSTKLAKYIVKQIQKNGSWGGYY